MGRLFEKQGYGYSVESLLSKVWGEYAVKNNQYYLVKACVYKIRQEKNKITLKQLIISIRNFGYKVD